MIEGMYKATFATALGHGTGIVVLRNGVIEGGDSWVYYSGSYTTNGDEFSAQISTTQYAAGGANLLGQPRSNVTVKGIINGEQITGDGSVGGFKVTLQLIRP